jgi:putative AlgH/UPF0301 family transcriptional regulator
MLLLAPAAAFFHLPFGGSFQQYDRLARRSYDKHAHEPTSSRLGLYLPENSVGMESSSLPFPSQLSSNQPIEQSQHSDSQQQIQEEGASSIVDASSSWQEQIPHMAHYLTFQLAKTLVLKQQPTPTKADSASDDKVTRETTTIHSSQRITDSNKVEHFPTSSTATVTSSDSKVMATKVSGPLSDLSPSTPTQPKEFTAGSTASVAATASATKVIKPNMAPLYLKTDSKLDAIVPSNAVAAKDASAASPLSHSASKINNYLPLVNSREKDASSSQSKMETTAFVSVAGTESDSAAAAAAATTQSISVPDLSAPVATAGTVAIVTTEISALASAFAAESVHINSTRKSVTTRNNAAMNASAATLNLPQRPVRSRSPTKVHKYMPRTANQPMEVVAAAAENKSKSQYLPLLNSLDATKIRKSSSRTKMTSKVTASANGAVAASKTKSKQKGSQYLPLLNSLDTMKSPRKASSRTRQPSNVTSSLAPSKGFGKTAAEKTAAKSQWMPLPARQQSLTWSSQKRESKRQTRTRVRGMVANTTASKSSDDGMEKLAASLPTKVDGESSKRSRNELSFVIVENTGGIDEYRLSETMSIVESIDVKSPLTDKVTPMKAANASNGSAELLASNAKKGTVGNGANVPSVMAKSSNSLKSTSTVVPSLGNLAFIAQSTPVALFKDASASESHSKPAKMVVSDASVNIPVASRDVSRANSSADLKVPKKDQTPAATTIKPVANVIDEAKATDVVALASVAYDITARHSLANDLVSHIEVDTAIQSDIATLSADETKTPKIKPPVNHLAGGIDSVAKPDTIAIAVDPLTSSRKQEQDVTTLVTIKDSTDPAMASMVGQEPASADEADVASQCPASVSPSPTAEIDLPNLSNGTFAVLEETSQHEIEPQPVPSSLMDPPSPKWMNSPFGKKPKAAASGIGGGYLDTIVGVSVPSPSYPKPSPAPEPVSYQTYESATQSTNDRSIIFGVRPEAVTDSMVALSRPFPHAVGDVTSSAITLSTSKSTLPSAEVSYIVKPDIDLESIAASLARSLDSTPADDEIKDAHVDRTSLSYETIKNFENTDIIHVESDQDEQDADLDVDGLDWRAFRAKLVLAEPQDTDDDMLCDAAIENCDDLDGIGSLFNDRTTTQSKLEKMTPLDQSQWAYDSGKNIEQGTVILGGVEQDFGFGLRQQYFHKAAMLVLEHQEETFTKGIILNRPTDFELEDDINPGIRYRVWFGGDVQGIHSDNPDLVCLHSIESKEAQKASMPIMNGLQWTTFKNAKRLVKAGVARADDFQVFCGYAGWGPGILRSEVDRNFWYTVATDSRTLIKELAQIASSDPREAGLETWTMLMTMIGRGSIAQNHDGGFDDCMIKEWSRQKLLSDVGGGSAGPQKRILDGMAGKLAVIVKHPAQCQAPSPASYMVHDDMVGCLVRASAKARSPFLINDQELHKSVVLIVMDDDKLTVGAILNRPAAEGLEMPAAARNRGLCCSQKVTMPLRFGGQYTLKNDEPLLWIHCSEKLRRANIGVPMNTIKGGIWKCKGEEVTRALTRGIATIDDFLVVTGVSAWTKEGTKGGIKDEIHAGTFEMVPVSKTQPVWNSLTKQKVLKFATLHENINYANEAWSNAGWDTSESFPEFDGRQEETGQSEPFVFTSPMKVSDLADEALTNWVATFLLGVPVEAFA